MTTPGRSALTVTPWTASIVPIALRVGCQLSSWITVEVTAAGGGAIFAPISMPFFTWKPLMSPNATNTSKAMTAARKK